MRRIGLLSDTHGCWDERYEKYFKECDEIWHAGDIGSMDVADRLAQIAPLRAVYGNIDSGDVRIKFPEVYRWKCEEVDVLNMMPVSDVKSMPIHLSSSFQGTLIC